MQNFNCPYDDMGCVGIDTSGMDKIPCNTCPHFNTGVRRIDTRPKLKERFDIKFLLKWLRR